MDTFLKILLILFVVLLIIGIIIYFTKNCNQRLIHNDGTVNTQMANPTKPQRNTIDSLVDEYGDFSPSDPSAEIYSRIDSDDQNIYDEFDKSKSSKKCRSMTSPDKNNEFTFKRKAFIKKTEDDIKEHFDIDKLLPQETEDDWFEDICVDKKAKRSKNTSYIDPQSTMGISTSLRKQASRDIRGDIPIPKKMNMPWMMSTIDPDPYERGICS